jgi:hypothetical protein
LYQESTVKIFTFSNTLVVVGLVMAAPAVAQTTPSGATTAQKQRTDGGDSPANPRATDAAAAAWHKQHIGGLPAGTSPPRYGAAWAGAQKQSSSAVGGTATKQQ